eukprot:2110967-Prymnesium_polylepis.1
MNERARKGRQDRCDRPAEPSPLVARGSCARSARPPVRPRRRSFAVVGSQLTSRGRHAGRR